MPRPIWKAPRRCWCSTKAMSRSIRKTTSRRRRRNPAVTARSSSSRARRRVGIGTSGIGIHDVMRINNGGRNSLTTKSMQDNDDGCGGVTCNDTGIGDGCPAAPEKDAKDPYHDTKKTWSRRMPRQACIECAKAYDNTIGYSYRTRGQQRRRGRLHQGGAGERHAGQAPVPGQVAPTSRCRRSASAASITSPGRAGSHRKSAAPTRSTSTATALGSRRARVPTSAVRPRTSKANRQTVHLAVASAPGCDQGCTPSTSCAQEGAQCGTIWNGCQEESCPSYCAPYQDCADNQCCTHAEGNCGFAYDECARQTVYLGTCGFDEVCENNWCVRSVRR